MISPLLLSLLATAAIAAPPSPTPAAKCRCRPSDSCWPSTKEWSALNKTIHGNLVAVRPVASVCHQAEYNADACKVVTDNWKDSVWRSSQPGAGQWENWEAWPDRNESCYLESAQDTVCQQGRISLYSAIAQSASDIQHAVRFASHHNLRLAIKNTGHDFLGRSTAPESLQILTHNMKDINIVDSFVPKGSSKSEGPAITIGAGIQLPEMYEAVAKRNRTVIAGAAHTVGAAGGYIQGGGHSPFGHWKGLASDNALEFQVVTADVSITHGENLVAAWFKLTHASRALFSPQTHTRIRTFFGL